MKYSLLSMGDTLILVSFPDPTHKEGKGLVYIKQFPGPLDTACHVIGMTINTSFWHGNASTTLTCMQYMAISAVSHENHRYISHGMNPIGA